MAANAYFGALPVREALRFDPDVVVCGRVTDTGITLGALMAAFDWSGTDFDRLAAGIVAGHVIECGAQATGGNFTDWRKVRSFDEMGFPVLECSADGTLRGHQAAALGRARQLRAPCASSSSTRWAIRART